MVYAAIGKRNKISKIIETYPEILQEKAEKTEESSALETTADFVINDGGRDISANPFGSVQEE